MTNTSDTEPRPSYLADHRRMMRDLLIWRDTVLAETDDTA